tara:strand:- start:148 stop:1008 length:861 start_codon:yes stop_codon:yes gene_type:complete
MPYIGKSPVGGGFHKLDNLTASATDTYALTLGSAAYYPETANQLLVSLNGVIQAPQDSFTVSGSNLIFDSALTASDSIDFVVALGDVLGVGSVTDGAVTTAKIGNNAVTSAKLATTIAPTNLETTASTFKMTDLSSNAFYRTGTFSPAYSSATATDVESSIFNNYVHQYGFYTRIGNLVYAQVDVKLQSGASFINGGGSSQNLTVAGLPFSIKNTPFQYPSINVGYFADWTGWGTGFTPMGYGKYGTKTITLTHAVANGTSAIQVSGIYNPNARIIFDLTYETDEA